MMGNCQVRFLGEGGTATCPLLPDKKQTRSVEYKTSGWKLSTDKRCLTFTEKLINYELRITNYEGIIRNS